MFALTNQRLVGQRQSGQGRTGHPVLRHATPGRRGCVRVEAGNGEPLVPQQVLDSLVYPAEGNVKGVCHFLGGAFAGAAPQAVYPLMIQSMVNSGYTVISTPYAITFKHSDCALEVHGRFQQALSEMRSSSLAIHAPSDVPVHGVGHSMGALLQVLIGSIAPPPYNTSNVVIAVNNKEVQDAIPVPGLVDALTVAIQTYERIPFRPPSPLPVLKDVLSQVFQAAPNRPAKDLFLGSVEPAIDQLDSVLGELRDGVSDFVPTPFESRRIIKSSYNVPSTLLVKFSNDTIDETPELVALLKDGGSRQVDDVLLDGSHVTPCGGDLEWLGFGEGPQQVTEAVRNVQDFTLRDINNMNKRIVDWMDEFVREEVGDLPSI